MQPQAKSGFTLLELAIVLVIIGLLAGGVLVGQDLIHAAELQKLIKQNDRYDAAVSVFVNKYNCLPGDCDKAVMLNLGTAGGVGDNGNGNGRIGAPNDDDPACMAGYNWSETVNFWYHLHMANLISDSFTTPHCNVDHSGTVARTPLVAMKSVGRQTNTAEWWILDYSLMGDFADWGRHPAFWLTSEFSLVANSDTAWMLPVDAQSIDTKMDDGMPMTGLVRGASNSEGLPNPSNALLGGDGVDSCANPAGKNPYNISDQTSMCSLIITAPF